MLNSKEWTHKGGISGHSEAGVCGSLSQTPPPTGCMSGLRSKAVDRAALNPLFLSSALVLSKVAKQSRCDVSTDSR